MRILLFGKTGQVGWELQRALAPLGDLIALGRADSTDGCGDLGNIDGIARTVREIRPDVLVNAAAYTAVDKAESEPELAYQLNAQAPTALAQEMARVGGLFVHYSTDYVFDGSGERPWREDDKTAPVNVYGESKLQGEDGIIRSGCSHVILRTSWVYAVRGANFAKTILSLAQKRDNLSVVADQVGAPTGADLLADITAHVIRIASCRPEVAGVYHVAAAGETSWHGYAKFIVGMGQRLGAPLTLSRDRVQPVPTSAYPTPARRPHNSRLNTGKLQEVFGLRTPSWEIGVTRMVTELLERS